MAELCTKLLLALKWGMHDLLCGFPFRFVKKKKRFTTFVIRNLKTAQDGTRNRTDKTGHLDFVIRAEVT